MPPRSRLPMIIALLAIGMVGAGLFAAPRIQVFWLSWRATRVPGVSVRRDALDALKISNPFYVEAARHWLLGLEERPEAERLRRIMALPGTDSDDETDLRLLRWVFDKRQSMDLREQAVTSLGERKLSDAIRARMGQAVLDEPGSEMAEALLRMLARDPKGDELLQSVIALETAPVDLRALALETWAEDPIEGRHQRREHRLAFEIGQLEVRLGLTREVEPAGARGHSAEDLAAVVRPILGAELDRLEAGDDRRDNRLIARCLAVAARRPKAFEAELSRVLAIRRDGLEGRLLERLRIEDLVSEPFEQALVSRLMSLPAEGDDPSDAPDPRDQLLRILARGVSHPDALTALTPYVREADDAGAVKRAGWALEAMAAGDRPAAEKQALVAAAIDSKSPDIRVLGLKAALGLPEISPELEARIKTLRETGETKAVKDAARRARHAREHRLDAFELVRRFLADTASRQDLRDLRRRLVVRRFDPSAPDLFDVLLDLDKLAESPMRNRLKRLARHWIGLGFSLFADNHRDIFDSVASQLQTLVWRLAELEKNAAKGGAR